MEKAAKCNFLTAEDGVQMLMNWEIKVTKELWIQGVPFFLDNYKKQTPATDWQPVQDAPYLPTSHPMTTTPKWEVH